MSGGNADEVRTVVLQLGSYQEQDCQFSTARLRGCSTRHVSVMGVKMLQCFPFYRRCKERCKSRQCPPATVPIEEMNPRLSSTTSWGSDSEGAGSLSRGSQIYFSTKARLSFRHQLDSNINAVDATY